MAKLHIPTTNTTTRIDVPIRWLTNVTINEFKACLKHDRHVSSKKYNFPKKEKYKEKHRKKLAFLKKLYLKIGYYNWLISPKWIIT